MLDRMRTQALCVALIADVVRSRKIQADDRAVLQETLHSATTVLNRRYRQTLLSRFAVTTGDEFQALFSTATPLPDVIWELEQRLPVRVRLGIGLGTLTTKLQRDAIGMDGPAWHNARDAIVDAKTHHRLGGVFKGFGDRPDVVLNGFARLLYDFRTRLTEKQRA